MGDLKYKELFLFALGILVTGCTFYMAFAKDVVTVEMIKEERVHQDKRLEEILSRSKEYTDTSAPWVKERGEIQLEIQANTEHIKNNAQQVNELQQLTRESIKAIQELTLSQKLLTQEFKNSKDK